MKRPPRKQNGIVCWYGAMDRHNTSPDLCVDWGPDTGGSPDARTVIHHLSPLLTEMERRGYDPSTLRFSITKKLP